MNAVNSSTASGDIVGKHPKQVGGVMGLYLLGQSTSVFDDTEISHTQTRRFVWERTYAYIIVPWHCIRLPTTAGTGKSAITDMNG